MRQRGREYSSVLDTSRSVWPSRFQASAALGIFRRHDSNKSRFCCFRFDPVAVFPRERTDDRRLNIRFFGLDP